MQHFVSDIKFNPGKIDAVSKDSTSLSAWQMAWRHLSKNPLFYLSGAVILIVLTAVVAPWLFTSADPTLGELSNSLKGPEPGHLLGFDSQGYDILSRIVYGASPSVQIGLLVTLFSTLFGGIIGALAGYFGGIMDTILSRITDIFYAVPLILGAIVVLSVMRDYDGIAKVVIVLSIFNWVSCARMMRGKVMETKNQEFITSSTALGQSRLAILFTHVVPNSLGPVIVTATTGLGGAIVSESTLTFLGLGIGGGIPSWGHDIDAAKNYLSVAPQLLIFPSIALALTVLAFILMGDAINEALDPKARS